MPGGDIRFMRIGAAVSNIEDINKVIEELYAWRVSKDVTACKRFLRALVMASIKEERPALEQILPPIKVTVPRLVRPPIARKIVEEVKPQIGVLYHGRNVTVNSWVKDDSYIISEPELDHKIVEGLKKDLFKRFKKDKSILADDRLLSKRLTKICKRLKVSYKEGALDSARYHLQRDWLGFGKVDALLRDSDVSAIVCDGVNRPLHVRHLGRELATNIVFESKEELDILIRRFAAMLKLDIGKSPVIDSALNLMVDGVVSRFRVEATYGIGEVSSRFILKRV